MYNSDMLESDLVDILDDNSLLAAEALQSMPDDFHEIDLDTAVRLTPATLAFHLTRGLWYPAPHLLYAATEIARALLEGNAHIIFNMPARHGKPLHVDEKVLMGDGTYKRLGDICGGDEVITHKGRPRKVLRVFEQGLLPCIRIDTKLGRTIVSAKDHSFMTHKGWLKAGELVIGDSLALVKEAQVQCNATRSAEEFRLAGYFIGDGACSYNQGGSSVNANITCKDEILLSDICHCTEQLGFRITPSERYNYQLSGGIRNWLRETTLAGGTSHTKVVPDWVLQAPLDLAMQFVGAYYECDGSIDRLGPQRQPTPTFNSVSLELLRGVQSILLRAGINSNISKAGVKVRGEPYRSYRLTVGSHKYLKSLLRLMQCKGEKGLRSAMRAEEFFNAKERKPSSDVWSNFLHDSVEEITEVGLKECKCLEVEEDHTFTVQDVVVHNSELTSVWTPTWWLDLFPMDHVILATYAADLSTGFGRRVRDTLIELGGVDGKPSPEHKVAGRPRLRTTVRSDVQQVGHFQTPEGGGMTSVGIGGVLTGRGANILLIDDYVKNAKEASSPTIQQDVYEWFQSTAYTRLEPGGSVVILATRWDKNDLTGMILKNQSDFQQKWRVIELPAVAYGDGTIDPIGRSPGQALWPERYPLERLLQIKAVIGKYFWEALYQQRPIKREEAKFDSGQIEVVTQLPHMSNLRLIRSWDLASSTTKKADYTAGTLMGADGPARSTSTNTFIIDQIHGKWGPHDLERKLVETALADGAQIPIRIEQEPGSSGKLYATHLKENVLRDFNVTIAPPPSDKWLRAQPFMAATTRGSVKIKKAAWNAAWLKEFEEFPSVEHDDRVDSTTQGYNHLNDTKNVSVSWGRNSTESGIITSSRNFGNYVRGATFGRTRNG